MRHLLSLTDLAAGDRARVCNVLFEGLRSIYGSHGLREIGRGGDNVVPVAGGTVRTMLSVPTVFRSGPYRFSFFGADRAEPPHVHVTRDTYEAKLWLSPLAVARGGDFHPRELRRIIRLVATHQQLLLRAWYEYFQGRS